MSGFSKSVFRWCLAGAGAVVFSIALASIRPGGLAWRAMALGWLLALANAAAAAVINRKAMQSNVSRFLQWGLAGNAVRMILLIGVIVLAYARMEWALFWPFLLATISGYFLFLFNEVMSLKAGAGQVQSVTDDTTIGTNVAGAVSAIQDRIAMVQTFVTSEVTDSHRLEFWPGIGIDLPDFLTVHGLMMILAACFLVALFVAALRKKDPVPTGLRNVLELFVLFIRDQICVPYLGDEDGRKMTPLFCSFFFFILTMNVMGLVPIFRTPTSNVSITTGLAVISLFIMIFGAIYRNGLVGFVKGFVPGGVPWPMLILVVPIEFMGLFIKTFALAIRLFANMLAGHIVTFALLGLVVVFGYVALPSVLIAVAIDVLELFVAFLQAYIFTLLSAIFIGQRYHPAH